MKMTQELGNEANRRRRPLPNRRARIESGFPGDLSWLYAGRSRDYAGRMSKRRVVYMVEFLSPEGVRLEYGEDGWRILNIRQLGEAARRNAQQLLERAELHADRAVIEPNDDAPLETRSAYVARKLGLRVTHKRTKSVETY